MKLEKDYAYQQQKFYNIPVRDQPDQPPVTPQELTSRRRTVRTETDGLINEGLLNGDPVALAACLGNAMLVMGGTYAQLGLEPSIQHLLLGAKEQVEDARAAMDRALTLRDWEAVSVAATRVQLTCGGLCYVLGLPYREILDALHKALMEGRSPDRADLVPVLRAAGVPVAEPPAANDPAPTPGGAA